MKLMAGDKTRYLSAKAAKTILWLLGTLPLIAIGIICYVCGGLEALGIFLGFVAFSGMFIGMCFLIIWCIESIDHNDNEKRRRLW